MSPHFFRMVSFCLWVILFLKQRRLFFVTQARRRRALQRRDEERRTSQQRTADRLERILQVSPPPSLCDRTPPAPRPWDAGDDAVLIAAVGAAMRAAEREGRRMHWGKVARTVHDCCGQISTGAECRERYARSVAPFYPQQASLAPRSAAPQAEARFAEPLAQIAEPPKRRKSVLSRFFRRALATRKRPQKPAEATAIEPDATAVPSSSACVNEAIAPAWVEEDSDDEATGYV